MALPQQLKASRMTDSTIGKDIDNHVGDLECIIADILGITVDVDVTESPISADNSGRITKQLLRLVAAAPMGIRLRDTTNSKEFRLALNNTSILIDENTGTEGTPVWTNRLTVALGTGLPTLAGATDPSADNDLARKAYVDATAGTEAGDAVTTHDGAATVHAAATSLVHTSGDETIAGKKTFTTIPEAPAADPTTDNQLARKAYVDAQEPPQMPYGGGYSAYRAGVASGTHIMTGWTTFPHYDVTLSSNKFYVAQAGTYLFAFAGISTPVNLTNGSIYLRKNGTTAITGGTIQALNGSMNVSFIAMATLAANDYIEIIDSCSAADSWALSLNLTIACLELT